MTRPGAAEIAESMVGNRYGQLTVLSVSGVKVYHYGDRVVCRPVLRVRCDCGNEFEIVYSNLNRRRDRRLQRGRVHFRRM